MTAARMTPGPTSSLIAAAARLADVLATENAALAALNMPAAARLLPEKLAATAAFTAAQNTSGQGAPGERRAARPGPELEALARRLRGQAELRQGLADELAGHVVRVEPPLLHAVQHGPEPRARRNGGAERGQQQQAAPRDHAGTVRRTPARAGAPTLARRSSRDRPPPAAITSAPNQIQGASGL